MSFDGQVPRTEADEFVLIRNAGDESVQLEGWRLLDIADGRPQFVFPAYALQPGAEVRVYTNEVHSEWGGFTFAWGRAIWSNAAPDTAALLDASGAEVGRRSYAAGEQCPPP